MQYIFGKNNSTNTETLLTKGENHSDLSGFQEIVQAFNDCIITDSFFVNRKLKQDTDTENNCYVWYEISQHNRMIDKTPSLQKQNEQLVKENELLKAQIKAQSDRSDFMEDCIAEMAMQVYS